MCKQVKVLGILVIAVLCLLAASCKSKDDKTETTTTTTEDNQSNQEAASDSTSDRVEGNENASTETVRKLSEDDFNEALELIDRARRAEAEKYDSENFANALAALERARDLNEDDPEAAREQWELSKKLSQEAYYNSLKQKALLEKEKAEKLFQDADAQGIDKEKDDYVQAKVYYDEGESALSEDKYMLAYTKYNDSVQLLLNMVDSSRQAREEHQSRIEYVKSLIRQAEELGAEEYAPEDLALAKEFLEKGISAFTEYEYDTSKENLDQAEQSALASIEKTKRALEELERQRALKAILEAGQTIEDVSRQPTINDRGEKEEGLNYEFEFDDENKDLQNAPNNGQLSTYQDVMKTAIDYLEKAKQAYREKEYDMAVKYAMIAKKVAESYSSTGIKTTYRVRLIPEKRDCLWRIAEYTSIYGNPFYWPRIWKANKKIISNPDLIYPGQMLVIPEVD